MSELPDCEGSTGFLEAPVEEGPAMELIGMLVGREELRLRGIKLRRADRGFEGVVGAETVRMKFGPGVDGIRPVCSLPNIRGL